MIDIETLDNVLRVGIIIELTTGLALWVYSGTRFKGHYRYSVAPILYILHAFLFIILTVFNVLPKDVYTIWRDILFIHGLLLLNMIGIVLIQVLRSRE